MAKVIIGEENVSKFRSIFKLIGGLVFEVQITLSQEALAIRAADPANVCLAILDLEKTFFKEFDVEKPVKFGIRLDDLNTILGRFNGELTLEAGDRLTISGQGISGQSKEFKLSMINLEEHQYKRPDLVYPGEVIMKAEYFVNALEDVSVATEDSTYFLIKSEKFSMEAKGKSDARIDFGDDVKVHFPDNIKANYSIEYLSKITSKITDEIQIRINKDFPLSLDYKNKDFTLTFILAPRVE